MLLVHFLTVLEYLLIQISKLSALDARPIDWGCTRTLCMKQLKESVDLGPDGRDLQP